jgi:hypothetical protein
MGVTCDVWTMRRQKTRVGCQRSKYALRGGLACSLKAAYDQILASIKPAMRHRRLHSFAVEFETSLHFVSISSL